MIHSGKLMVLVAVLGVALTACGVKKNTDHADVAVKVNGEAITSVELQDNARQHTQIRSGQEVSVPGDVIKSQIDMELLRQAAVKDKLDADKLISARLAESNRFILATAYLEKQMAAIAKPGEAEIKAYFDQHPDRYAERKQYDLQELRIQTGPDNAAKIRKKLGSGKNFKAFVRWLNEKKIQNNGQQLVVTADQMPEEILQKLESIKPGEAITIDGKDQLNVILVNAVKPQPVTLEQASPMIEKMLDKKHKQDGMNDMMKQLREKAKIEYVPPYTANGMTVSGNQ
jgi:EpsD family peptidyl-prolyl cis-trans isomerase